MRLAKLPIGTAMLVVAFAALLCFQVRTFLDFSSDLILNNEEYYGPPLIVGANLLLLLGAVRLMRLWRVGHLCSSFWAGFQIAGWGSLLLFVSSSLLIVENTHAYYGNFDPFLLPLAGVLQPILDIFPANSLAGQTVNFFFLAIGLGLPMLVVGLIGGLIAWALGIEVEIRLRRRFRGAATEESPR